MIFNHIIGQQNIEDINQKVNHREAVRAVVFKDNKLLMIQSRWGDYKFPGGGLKKGEIAEDALKRETMEETGYSLASVDEKLGVIKEIKLDEYQKGVLFVMTSNYYACRLGEGIFEQNLDPYEEIQKFKPVWLEIARAIKANEEILQQPSWAKNPWVFRETLALKFLRDHFEQNSKYCL